MVPGADCWGTLDTDGSDHVHPVHVQCSGVHDINLVRSLHGMSFDSLAVPQLQHHSLKLSFNFLILDQNRDNNHVHIRCFQVDVDSESLFRVSPVSLSSL